MTATALSRLDHDDDERERYVCRVDTLNVGDQFFSPARRWETVTRIADAERYSTWTRVFTDVTGAGYAWKLADFREVPVLRAWQRRGTPMVRVDDSRRFVTAFVGTAEQRYGFTADAPVLAEARQLGRGQGWQVTDRPAGGDVVITQVAGKAAALSAVRRAAKAHAKALGLPLQPAGAGR